MFEPSRLSEDRPASTRMVFFLLTRTGIPAGKTYREVIPAVQAMLAAHGAASQVRVYAASQSAKVDGGRTARWIWRQMGWAVPVAQPVQTAPATPATPPPAAEEPRQAPPERELDPRDLRIAELEARIRSLERALKAQARNRA